MPNEIAFPPDESFEAHDGCVVFPAYVNGRRLNCRITTSALRLLPGGEFLAPLETFRSNRHAIESLAVAMILRDGGCAPDVLISRPDVTES